MNAKVIAEDNSFPKFLRLQRRASWTELQQIQYLILRNFNFCEKVNLSRLYPKTTNW